MKTYPCNKQRIFSALKMKISLEKNYYLLFFYFVYFDMFSQNIDCGYTLEPPRRGGSNEYPQSMFWNKNKKIRYTPASPSFLYKNGVQGELHHTGTFS